MGDFVQRMGVPRIGGRYQLVHLPGEGSFGKVYLGEHNVDQQLQSRLLISIGRDVGTSSSRPHPQSEPELWRKDIRAVGCCDIQAMGSEVTTLRDGPAFCRYPISSDPSFYSDWLRAWTEDC